MILLNMWRSLDGILDCAVKTFANNVFLYNRIHVYLISTQLAHCKSFYSKKSEFLLDTRWSPKLRPPPPSTPTNTHQEKKAFYLTSLKVNQYFAFILYYIYTGCVWGLPNDPAYPALYSWVSGVQGDGFYDTVV